LPHLFQVDIENVPLLATLSVYITFSLLKSL
jgi:hypothetical protein